MKKVYLFIFMLFTFISFSSLVLAKGEVSVVKVEPYFDEDSGVVGEYEGDMFSVQFNDVGQEVSYKISLKNNTDKPYPLVDLSVPLTEYGFVEYEFEGLKINDLLDANEEKEIILTLKTVDNDVYARNFKEELVLAFNFSTEFNPDTVDIIGYISLIFIISCILFFIIKNTKVKTYVLGIIFMMGFVSFVNADNYIVVKIPGIVSYKSLNILKASGVTYDEGLLDVEQECTYPVKSENFCDVAIKDNSHTVIYDNVIDFWKYASDIQNIYIKNDIVDIKDYEYKFDVTYNDENRVFAYLVLNDNDYYDLYLMANGIIYANENSTGLFAGMENLEKIDNIEGLDFSESERLGALFYDTLSLEKIDLTSFNTSNAIDMSNMFAYTSSVSQLDVSSFDTSKVNDMYGMFMGSSVENLDLSSFDTSKVVTTSYMFASNSDLKTLNLGDMNTQSVFDMSFMFYGLGKLKELDVSSFDTSNVIRMNGMFAGDSEFEIFTSYSLKGLEKFNTKNLVSMYGMFAYNGLSKLDLSHFETPKLENMQFAFANMPNLRCVLLTNFDYSNVKYMASFLFNAYATDDLLVDMTSFDPETFDGEFGIYSIYQNGYDIGLYAKNSEIADEISYYNDYSLIDLSDSYASLEECCIWPK